MLRAIWVDDEDERILVAGMDFYKQICEDEGTKGFWEPVPSSELLRVRTLANRLGRAVEARKK